MNDTIKVSVVIPTFNRARFLERAVKSVLMQTFENVEIVIVDDASDDNTREIAANFNNDRITYLRHENNLGGGSARNSGIKASKGEYIAFLDDDDEMLPERIEKQVRKIEASSPDVGMIDSGAEIISPDGKTVKKVYIPDVSSDIERRFLLGTMLGSTSFVMVKKECFEKAGLFDEGLTSCQDWDMWLRISRHYRSDAVREVLTRMYLHDKRISTDFRSLILGRERMLEKYAGLFMGYPGIYTVHVKKLGKLYALNGSWKEALVWFLKAVNISPFEVFKIMAWLVLDFPKARFFSKEGTYKRYNTRIPEK